MKDQNYHAAEQIFRKEVQAFVGDLFSVWWRTLGAVFAGLLAVIFQNYVGKFAWPLACLSFAWAAFFAWRIQFRRAEMLQLEIGELLRKNSILSEKLIENPTSVQKRKRLENFLATGQSIYQKLLASSRPTVAHAEVWIKELDSFCERFLPEEYPIIMRQIPNIPNCVTVFAAVGDASDLREIALQVATRTTGIREALRGMDPLQRW